MLSLEGDDWFESGKVATLADIYINNHSSSTIQSSVSTNAMNVRGGYSSRFNSNHTTRGAFGGTMSDSHPASCFKLPEGAVR